jgi:hypothetical protein
MSVLAALDATRICSRSPADPSAWVMAAPPAVRRERPSISADDYAWSALVRNPLALVVSGVIGAMATVDAVRNVVSRPTRPVP